MAKLAALAVVLLLYSPSASAWGGLGHEAVCELAFLELHDTGAPRALDAPAIVSNRAPSSAGTKGPDLSPLAALVHRDHPLVQFEDIKRALVANR